jgi:glycerol-3-phosphate dehydrogenase
MGGEARNYSAVAGLLKTADGRHCGVTVRENKDNGSTYEVRAKAIINATGIWTDDVCRSLGTSPRIRRQRGSHLIIPFEKLPLKRGVMFNHPADNRIQFAIPWYGRVLLGTTDLDEPVQDYGITDEPDISPKELDYLLYSINTEFPGSDVKTSDIIATFCGIRPIVRNNSDRPYASSRKFQIWDDNGMVTIAGGKLTTFQHMGYQALKHAQKYLDKAIQPDAQHAFLSQEQRLDRELKGKQVEKPLIRQKYGLNAAAYLRDQQDDPQAAASIIAGQFTQADIRWAARREMVAHLDDLLLRRTRIGLLLKDGGIEEIQALKEALKQDLSWDEDKWNAEVARYKKIWQTKYSLPV